MSAEFRSAPCRRPAKREQDGARRSRSGRTLHHGCDRLFNFDTLAQRLRELAFLNKGLKITLTDEREDPVKDARVPLQRRYRGVHQASESRARTLLHDKPIHFEADRELPNGDSDHGSRAAV